LPFSQVVDRYVDVVHLALAIKGWQLFSSSNMQPAFLQQFNTACDKSISAVSWPNNDRDEKEDATKEP
jgi:uncharacterized membrane protein